MSEYQYYEFLAIDRALSTKEMAELRAYSSRARITPTSFINHYNWGSLKGDPNAWMDRYFDAFLYLANWRSREFKLRLPSELLDLADARQYCSQNALTARETNGKVVLTFTSQDDDDDDCDTGEGILPSLVALRAELAWGDRRALYLGWLLALQAEELDDDDLEPPVPPGLGQLNASLEALVGFMRIDRDFLQVAAETSAPMPIASPPSRKALVEWLATVAPAEKDKWLARVLAEDALSVSAELNRRFKKDHAPGRARLVSSERRTVGEIRCEVERRAEERRLIAERKAAAEAEQRRQTAARERAKHLASLAGKETRLWADVEQLVAARQGKQYDAAVSLLVDLRDLAARSGAGDFRTRLEALRTLHARKPALLQRLSKAGL
jgi:hypothetical protein